MLDAFFTLDFRTWRADEAEIPRETWADVEKKLIASGKDETEMGQARTDWEDPPHRTSYFLPSIRPPLPI